MLVRTTIVKFIKYRYHGDKLVKEPHSLQENK